MVSVACGKYSFQFYKDNKELKLLAIGDDMSTVIVDAQGATELLTKDTLKWSYFNVDEIKIGVAFDRKFIYINTIYTNSKDIRSYVDYSDDMSNEAKLEELKYLVEELQAPYLKYDIKNFTYSNVLEDMVNIIDDADFRIGILEMYKIVRVFEHIEAKVNQ